MNQGDVLLTGKAGVGTWIRIGVNFLVRFCVASVGFLAARRAPAGGPPETGTMRDRPR